MKDRRVVLITGCSSGIGYDLIRPLLSEGYEVFASLRNLEQRKDLFKEIAGEYGSAFQLLELDVTSEADRKAALAKLGERGRLDVLINNAGFGIYGAFEDASAELIRRQLEVNFFGTALLTREALPLLRQSRGRILTISSILGSVSPPFTSLYAASKFALEGLFEALSFEVHPFGVQVGLVLPGGHRTKFGDNLENITSQSSPYFRDAKAYFNVVRGRPDSKRAPANKVTAAVVRLLARKRMPLRTFVGADAILLHCLHSLLPQSIFQPLLRVGVRVVSRMGS